MGGEDEAGTGGFRSSIYDNIGVDGQDSIQFYNNTTSLKHIHEGRHSEGELD